MANDMQNIREGFDLLEPFDDDTLGDVSASYERVIYAGSGDRPESDYPARIRQQLNELGWHFSEDIGRWGYGT